MGGLRRTVRLDSVALIQAVAAATGETLALTGTSGTGEVGAAFVRRADGAEAVLSAGHGAAALSRAAAGLEMARVAGLPVPRYLEVIPLGEQVALLQERLPGRPPDRVDVGLIEQLLTFVEDLRTLRLPGDVGPESAELFLTGSGPGYCVHESLARYDERTRELLAWVRSVGDAEGSLLPGSDLVHLDLHPGNVLVDEAGTITGVVDWDAAGRGDARLGWVTLLFDLIRGVRFDDRYADVGARTVRRLEDRIGALDPGLMRQCWAHMSLRQVDWSLRHHPKKMVEHHLRVANEGRRRHRLG